MTDAELAVLSIVAEGPIYGYDIQTVIAQRGLRSWTNIGVSSLYYVLEKLERQGLIESRGAGQLQGAARRQYRITPAGFGILQTAVADLISTPREHGNGFELGLANLHVLRPSQIRTAFMAYRQELTTRLAQVRERWHRLRESQAPFNVDAMFGHHVAMLEAELEWIDRFIAEWEAQAPPDDHPAVPAQPVEIPRMKQVVLPHDPDSPHRLPTRQSGPPRVLSEADTDVRQGAGARETPPGAHTPPPLAYPPAANGEDNDPLAPAGGRDPDTDP